MLASMPHQNLCHNGHTSLRTKMTVLHFSVDHALTMTSAEGIRCCNSLIFQ